MLNRITQRYYRDPLYCLFVAFGTGGFYWEKFMNTNIQRLNETQTMSSTEIAKLTGKEKKHIHVDIRTQLLVGLYEIPEEMMVEISTINKINGLQIILDNRGYWSEVRLDRYHTDILVSGYEVKYRAAIIRRWQELESQQPKLPATYLEALKALVVETEAKELAQAQLEVKTQQLDESKEWCSVKRVAKVNAKSHTDYSWVDLKRQSMLLGRPPRKIFDANYGEVNTYHVEAWIAAYPDDMFAMQTEDD